MIAHGVRLDVPRELILFVSQMLAQQGVGKVRLAVS